MPVSIEVPQATAEVFELAFDRLKEIDERFSTYKPGSEVSRLVDGDIEEDTTSRELKKVIEACREAEAMTEGYFSAWASGIFDPSGYVKGWAINEAGQIIKKNGYKTFCIGVGGDILAASEGKKIWRIGIQDPKDKYKILNKLSILSGAVATSGNYERGAHIINPKTRKSAEGFLSVSIIGPDIIKADVLATAVFAMGPKLGKAFMKKQKNYKSFLVTA